METSVETSVETAMKPDVEIDLKGEVCPYTFVYSKLAVEEMNPGEILRVLVDHIPATKNVPRSMENEGHTVLRVAQINDTDWEMVIRKSEG